LLILSLNYLKPLDIFSSNIALMLAIDQKPNDAEKHITFHVDMDSFFASVEVRERPEL
jgi:DNA polymerase IV (DinB-like DNA polymerase)